MPQRGLPDNDQRGQSSGSVVPGIEAEAGDARHGPQPIAQLGEVGFDPVYGARPLKRAIQQQLENPLAQKILAGEFTSGDTIHVDAEAGRLAFR